MQVEQRYIPRDHRLQEDLHLSDHEREAEQQGHKPPEDDNALSDKDFERSPACSLDSAMAVSVGGSIGKADDVTSGGERQRMPAMPDKAETLPTHPRRQSLGAARLAVETVMQAAATENLQECECSQTQDQAGSFDGGAKGEHAVDSAMAVSDRRARSPRPDKCGTG